MRTLIYVLATTVIAGFAPSVASAADLGGYDERDTVIERSPPVVEHERIIERRYYEPDDYYDDAPVVTYYAPRYRRPYPYYAAYPYPYRFGPYYHRRYWRPYRHW